MLSLQIGGPRDKARFSLMKFTDSITAMDRFDPSFALPLFDSNGNRVGAVSVSDE
jgi:hypothetical protein